MITKTHDIVLQLTEPDYIKSGIKLVANDYLTNIFNIKIYENAAEISYPSIHHATVVFAKPDNTYVEGDLTKTSTGFTYTVGTNAIAAYGEVTASVQLFGSNNERLSTARFQFTVLRDLADKDAVESTSEFPILQQLVADVENLKASIINLQLPDNSIPNLKMAPEMKKGIAGGVAAYDTVQSHLSDLAAHGDILRNAVINNNFLINQRAVSGTVTLSAGQYGHDRWKAGSAGCTYTFTTVNNVTTLTITSGSLKQIIEGKNLYTGTYTLSWTGTSQGKIGTGSYGNSGVTGSVGGGIDLSIEFGIGTLSKVVLNFGGNPFPFLPKSYADELQTCQRYYEIIGTHDCYIYCDNSPRTLIFDFKTTKRVIPTCKVYDFAGNENKITYTTSSYVLENNKTLYGDATGTLSAVEIAFVPPIGYINARFSKLIADAEL
ncbi:MAG: hypothetical protein K0R50_1250 [Eubacterium sp.]|jgi:hypothetical protein|nr:hypothetical protein [Eubacterium sp.]